MYKWLWWGKQKYDIEGKMFLSVPPRTFCRRTKMFWDRNAWFLKKMEYFVFSHKTFCTLLEKYCIPLRNFAFSHRSIMFHQESFSEECSTFAREYNYFVRECKVFSVPVKSIVFPERRCFRKQNISILSQKYCCYSIIYAFTSTEKNLILFCERTQSFSEQCMQWKNIKIIFFSSHLILFTITLAQ